MRRTYERMRAHFGELARFGVAALCLLGLMISMLSAFAFKQASIIWEDGTEQVVLTSSNDQNEILDTADVTLGPNDEVVLEKDALGNINLYVYSSFQVKLRVDSTIHEETVAIGVVSDILEMNKVNLDENDMVSHEPDQALMRGMEIVVTRVDYQENNRRAEVLDEDVEEYIASLPEDEQNTFKRSKSRIYDIAAIDRLEDGKIVSSELTAITAVYHPSDAAKPLPFEAGVARSSIDSFVGIEIGEDGIPTTYTSKIEGANSTAYSSSGTGLGAGGQGLYCGTVAVNPNIIPYGTRLYITAADGSFVYGFAIASDTGIAMMDGRAAIDLYFESNTECNAFGRRWLDVYILD